MKRAHSMEMGSGRSDAPTPEVVRARVRAALKATRSFSPTFNSPAEEQKSGLETTSDFPFTARAHRDHGTNSAMPLRNYLVSLEEFLEVAGLSVEGYRRMRLRGEGPREVVRLREEVFVVMQDLQRWTAQQIPLERSEAS